MHISRFFLGTTLLLLAMGEARADEGSPDAARTCYDRFEKISTLVLEQHFDPPTRQEMFLGGMQGICKRAGLTAPVDLSKRVSRLSSGEQFRDFLAENWPKTEGKQAVSAAELQSAFVEGLFLRLPERVEIIPAPEYRAMEQVAANRYVGTGIQLTHNAKEDRPQVVIALPRGPLRKAGGKSDDFIVEIDGQDTKGMRLQETVAKLRGLEGSVVNVRLRQPDEKESRLLKITRGPVPFDTVMGFRRLGEEKWQYRVSTDEPLAYIRLSSVLPSTPSELRKLERTLLDDGIKGVVLDLRAAGGDDAQSAALTADELLDGGVMWRLRDNKGRVKDVRADRDCILRGIPIVALVNEFSLGSAEFIAAALQDTHRALIVGTPSSGNGTITSLVALPDAMGGVKLPTSRVERSVAAKDRPTGDWRLIQPDRLVPMSRDKYTPVMRWHGEQASPDARSKDAKAPEDVQLAKALELLRTKVKK